MCAYTYIVVYNVGHRAKHARGQLSIVRRPKKEKEREREKDLLHAPGRRFSGRGRRVRGRGSTAATVIVVVIVAVDDQEITGKTTTTAATAELRHPDTVPGYNPVTARCHRPEKQNTMISILFFRCLALHADLAD